MNLRLLTLSKRLSRCSQRGTALSSWCSKYRACSSDSNGSLPLLREDEMLERRDVLLARLGSDGWPLNRTDRNAWNHTRYHVTGVISHSWWLMNNITLLQHLLRWFLQKTIQGSSMKNDQTYCHYLYLLWFMYILCSVVLNQLYR